jgi:hypothetical protein
MSFQANVSGNFQEDRFYTLPIEPLLSHLPVLEGSKSNNLAETHKYNIFPPNFPLASCPRRAIYSRRFFQKLPKGTLIKETCLMQVSLAFVHFTGRHFNI